MFIDLCIILIGMRFNKSKHSLVWHVRHTPNTALPDIVDMYTL